MVWLVRFIAGWLMNFSFRHVEVFWAVMTTGSATGAAELLHTSQPTISRELSRFETLTQLTLFKR
ncbi:LysR family transcriptional regulator, partial [Klebsiella pneumoniae]